MMSVGSLRNANQKPLQNSSAIKLFNAATESDGSTCLRILIIVTTERSWTVTIDAHEELIGEVRYVEEWLEPDAIIRAMAASQCFSCVSMFVINIEKRPLAIFDV